MTTVADPPVAATATRRSSRQLRAPDPIDFGTNEYMAAPDLEAIGASLIRRTLSFTHLEQAVVTYLWKSKGGNGKGKRTLGKCQKPSGLLYHFAACDFVIWLAADHVRELQFDARRIEALVFHELCHADYEEDEENGAGRFTIAGHDVEAFMSEVRSYGAYTEDLQQFAGVCRQLSFEDVAG